MSNLLDLASIVLTPTAYNNGEALCIKPDDASGDFQFSRNSAATRVNAQGLVENVQILSSNLVTNGDFDTDSDWTKGTGWSISDGKAVAVSGTSSKLTQSISGLSGKKCSVTFTLSNYGGNGTIKLDFGSLVGQDRNANGTYTEVGTYDIDRLEFFKNSSFSGSIDNVSVIEITTDTSLPRINYEGFSYDGSGNVVPDSGCGSWLWEPQSTNLITQSELFSDATWTKVGGGAADDTIITSNYATSPDGTNNASRAQFNAVGTANGDRANLYANINVTSGQTFTMSFYGKSATATNEEVVLRMGSVQQVSVTLTQEYQRFSHTYTVTSSGAKNFGIQIRGNSAVTSADIIIWGFQVEQQSYATSYIPTSGSTVTRNQDVCTNGGSLASINSTEGVLYAEIAALADDLTLRSISLSDGTTNNVATIRYRTNSNRIQVVVFNGGVLQFSNSFDVTNILDFNKVAISYNQSDFNYWVNGVKRANSTSGNTPIGMNKLSFDNGGSHPFFGKTKALAVWKEALSDQELAELTTI